MNWRHASTTHSVSFDNTDLLWSYLACATIIPPPLFIQKLHTRFSKQELSFFYVREALNTCRLPHPTKRDNNSAATKPPALMESFSEDRVEYSSCYPNKVRSEECGDVRPICLRAGLCVTSTRTNLPRNLKTHTHTQKTKAAQRSQERRVFKQGENTRGQSGGIPNVFVLPAAT